MQRVYTKKTMMIATTPRTEMEPTRDWPRKASDAIFFWNGVRFLMQHFRSLFGIDL